MTNVTYSDERMQVRKIYWPNYAFVRIHSAEYFQSSINADDGECFTLIYFGYLFIGMESIDVPFDCCVFIPTLAPSTGILYVISISVWALGSGAVI